MGAGSGCSSRTSTGSSWSTTAMVISGQDDSVATALLGSVERRVSALEGDLGGVAHLGARASDGHRHPQIHPARGDARTLDEGLEPLCDCAKANLVHVGDRQRELLAAEAGNVVDDTGGLQQGPGNGPKRGIAGRSRPCGASGSRGPFSTAVCGPARRVPGVRARLPPGSRPRRAPLGARSGSGS